MEKITKEFIGKLPASSVFDWCNNNIPNQDEVHSLFTTSEDVAQGLINLLEKYPKKKDSFLKTFLVA